MITVKKIKNRVTPIPWGFGREANLSGWQVPHLGNTVTEVGTLKDRAKGPFHMRKKEMIWGTGWEANLSGWQVPHLRKIVPEVGTLGDPDKGKSVHTKWKTVTF